MQFPLEKEISFQLRCVYDDELFVVSFWKWNLTWKLVEKNTEELLCGHWLFWISGGIKLNIFICRSATIERKVESKIRIVFRGEKI